ncbi:hypothetical protein DPMN_130355 [Dreissena polymorpha]|uniref:TLC domain-containing protein n=1 Tax=Dreissena polymorpha TaxID=45954 RepID=A0A9D4K197_DREPO|nr:hypothetical protein DPMN_130355 [Dreissena polymorpha]
MFTEVFCSWFVFLCFVYFLSIVLSSRFVTLFNTFALDEKHKWNCRIIDFFNGFVNSGFGFWATFIDSELRVDVVHSTNWGSVVAVEIAFAFFTFELIMDLVANFFLGKKNKMVTLHHILATLSYALFSIYGKLHYFAARALFLDMVLPPQSAISILQKLGMKGDRRCKISAYVLAFCYHSRSIFEWYALSVLVDNYEHVFNEGPAVLVWITLTLIGLATLIMTPYWTAGAWRLILEGNCVSDKMYM